MAARPAGRRRSRPRQSAAPGRRPDATTAPRAIVPGMPLRADQAAAGTGLRRNGCRAPPLLQRREWWPTTVRRPRPAPARRTARALGWPPRNAHAEQTHADPHPAPASTMNGHDAGCVIRERRLPGADHHRGPTPATATCAAVHAGGRVRAWRPRRKKHGPWAAHDPQEGTRSDGWNSRQRHDRSRHGSS